MIRIALLEDEDEAANLFDANIKRYSKEYNIEFYVTRFDNAVVFLADYKPVYDIVFMDIMMPDMNGIEAAKKLRSIDRSVLLIFLTNLAQFAIKGYEVDAMDFVVKPISYYGFVLKMQRVMEKLTKMKDVELTVKSDNSVDILRSSQIKYIEVTGHKLVFHTFDGILTSYGSLKKIESQLADANFARCNSCYLVNLKYVSSVRGYTAVVDGEELQISFPKRKEFVAALNAFLGRGGAECL